METSFVKIGDIARKFKNFESPIEEKIGQWLEKFGIIYETQKKIGKYRADIFIKTRYSKIVIECDGEQYHKDKAKDRSRDQYMQELGYIVLRFTGSQINTNAEACTAKIIESISEVYGLPEYQDYLQKKIKSSLYSEEIDDLDIL